MYIYISIPISIFIHIYVSIYIYHIKLLGAQVRAAFCPVSPVRKRRAFGSTLCRRAFGSTLCI